MAAAWSSALLEGLKEGRAQLKQCVKAHRYQAKGSSSCRDVIGRRLSQPDLQVRRTRKIWGTSGLPGQTLPHHTFIFSRLMGASVT